MKEDNKIYMNQIWHKIHKEEANIKTRKEDSTKQRIRTLLLGLIMLLFTACLIIEPEILKGSGVLLGLIVLSSITFSEYKKLKGVYHDF